MKNLLFFLLLLFCEIASAQMEYKPTYSRQAPSVNSSQQSYTPPSYTPQSSSQIIRTTAYSVDYQGRLYKMPIKVQVTNNGYGSITIRVVEKYVDTGFGGNWTKVYSGHTASKCTSFASSNSLESEFMYKVLLDDGTWYFDL